MGYKIAIDGPAGSGKGTVAKALANRLGFVHLDSGAIYRCVTLVKVRNNIPLEDVEQVAEIANNIEIEFSKDNMVLMNGEDVTKAIRSQEVTEWVSPTSANELLRKNVGKMLEKMADKKNIIMEGRDIGTVVFPNADVKFYLDADIKERAKRRYKENQEKGIGGTYDEVLETMKKRDYNDMNKKVGALIKADDAIYVDSTNLTIQEVVDTMEEYVKNSIGKI